MKKENQNVVSIESGSEKSGKPSTNPSTNPYAAVPGASPVIITPSIEQMTTRGVEMFKDMGNIENAKKVINGLVAVLDYDRLSVASLMLLLRAIKHKIRECELDAEDFIAYLEDHLFTHTIEFDRCSEAYIIALESGNFTLDRYIDLSVPEPDPSNAQSLKVAA